MGALGKVWDWSARPAPFSWSPEQTLPLFSPSFSFEKWALMPSTWEADGYKNFLKTAPGRPGSHQVLTEAHSILLSLHGTDRAQAEGKFLASGNTYWLGNRRRGL